MTVIVCLDNANGMMFNHRRQSRDANVVKDILKTINGASLLIAPYSEPLFSQAECSVSISDKPTGWHTVKYDNVDGKYLYNRCHLIGYQLSGENANTKNLITGTRYLNIQGMLPFENMVSFLPVPCAPAYQTGAPLRA